MKRTLEELEKENATAKEYLAAEATVSKAARADLQQVHFERITTWSLLQEARAELQAITSQYHNFVDAANKLKARYIGLGTHFKASEKRVKKLKKETEEARKAKVQTEAQLRAQAEEYTILREDHERTLTQFEIVPRELATTEAHVRAARQELLEAKQTGLRSVLEAEVTRVPLAAAEANLGSARRQLTDADALRGRISTLETAAECTHDQLASLREEKALQDRQIAGYVTEVQRTRAESTAKEALLRGMRTEVERLRGVMTAMRKSAGDSKELQAKIKSLTRELQQAQANNLVKQEDDPPTSILDLQHELSRLRPQLLETLEDARTWKSDAKSLQEWLAAEISRNEQMRKAAIARDKELDAMKKELGKATGEGSRP